ncbi:winged helix-turn-helix transcriptional regulator [Brevibacillus sp. SYP-B805]|uniref:MarR family winged helix-turn-helix transcriptional regulator n=1 Tax=Brevibacillus sp. SYP-B805 TaxID=1578199 RepID=UPI0013EE09EB|nr:MarR family winged helix-turn-helix transcriptional regulator [Brevibacillus sp. SYP-B805]NGQ93649.1 winged helix-turn-helix transcriptional regulator [Brevibacillus sp. SYP-B805]
MQAGSVRLVYETLNMLRAINVVNKEDWERAAKEADLDSSVQLNILWIIYCYEGVRVTQIADWTFWHPSSIVIHIKKLMEKGLVVIEKSELDGRVVHVYPTQAGRAVIEKSRQNVPAIFRLTYALEKLEERYSPAVVALFFECLAFLAQTLHGGDKVRWIQESEDRLPLGEHQIS